MVIDLHCHLLPAVDDGPADMAATLAMARAHVEAGVTRVAATPHVSWDVATTAAAMASGAEGVRRSLADDDIPLEVVTGAEIALTRGADLDDAELAALALGGGPWLLVEAPLAPSIGVVRVVHVLQARGFRLVLAHPERSPTFHRRPEELSGLVADGVLTSVTATALSGRFGGTVQRFARRMAHEGLIHTVASDAHDVDRRPPGLRAPLEEAELGDYADWWCDRVPAAILAGEPDPIRGLPAPEAPRRTRFSLRLRGR